MADVEWIDERMLDLERTLLRKVFACETQESVEACVTYARFLASLGLDPQNKPAFLRLLEIDNKWVADALVGDKDPEHVFAGQQPSTELVRSVFASLGRWRPGSSRRKYILALLGVVRRVYASPRDGLRIYPLTLAELSALCKHLDKAKGQDDAVNRAILGCLDKLSSVEDPGEPALERLAVQAANVRDAFFDDRRKISDVIPEILLAAGETSRSVKPREQQPFDARRARARGK